MHITLTFADFLVLAAIIFAFSRVPRLSDDGESSRDFRARRQLDAIMNKLGLPEPEVSRPGSLTPEVIALIEGGRKLEAIQRYRQETGADLKEATAAVAAVRQITPPAA